MNDAERQHARALIERLIAQAQEDIASGSYPQALVAIRKAKALDITNIYILAFERQAEQLQELTSSGTLTDDQRTDILESLPGIIEQALATQAPLATPETAEAERRSTPEQREQIRAARQWLKNQYFQRTHEHVKKQEYDRALAELRRVFVIDSQDQFAREFELKIQQMQELQKHKPPPSAEVRLPTPQPSPARVEPAEADAEPPAPASDVAEEQPAASPQEMEPSSAVSTDESGAQGNTPRKGNRVLAMLLVIAVIVVAFAFYYFWKRDRPVQPIVPPPSNETEQEASGDEPVYTIPPALSVDSTKTDSTGAGTMKTDSTQVDTSGTP